MKKSLFAAGLFVLSFGALADNCMTQMVDYQGYVRVNFTQTQPNYMDPYCSNGYQQCLASIRLNPALRPYCQVIRVDNYEDQGNYYPQPAPRPRPQYNPRPYPQPAPAPRPQTDPRPSSNNGNDNRNAPPRAGTSSGHIEPAANGNRGRSQPRIELDRSALVGRTSFMVDGKEALVEPFDGQRDIEVGETVLMYNALYTVVDAEKDEFTIQPEKGSKKDIVKVSRSKIAVTRGCTLGVCVTDPVYNSVSKNMEAVAGITYDGDVVTKNSVTGVMIGTPVKLSQIAPAKGCVVTKTKEDACVGNTVQASNNLYYEILAVQYDGKVVVRAGEGRSSAVYGNIDPASFKVVR